MEEANKQMFKGDLWMTQRQRNGVVFLQGPTEYGDAKRRHASFLELSTRPSNDGKRVTKPREMEVDGIGE